MTEPLTAAVIVSLFFSEAIKEGGKALTKGVTDTFAQFVNTIREKFRAEGTEGLLKRAESEPTEKNKEKLQDELQTQMDADEAFTNKLKELVQQLQAQDERIRQIVLSEIERIARQSLPSAEGGVGKDSASGTRLVLDVFF